MTVRRLRPARGASGPAPVLPTPPSRRRRLLVAAALTAAAGLGIAAVMVNSSRGSVAGPVNASHKALTQRNPTLTAAASAGAAHPVASTRPAGAGALQSAATTTASAHPSALPAVLDATLSASCVRPRQSERLSVHTQPHYSVVFNTYYPDGSEGTAHATSATDRPYGGGYADSSGDWSATWTVASSTPEGNVTLRVGSSNGSPPDYVRTLGFRVDAEC